MAVVSVDMEVSLDDFDDSELREELECRGYYVNSSDDDSISEATDRDLIDELQDRGFTVYGKSADVIFKIYQSYLLDTPEQLQETLKKIFAENGLRP